MLMPYNETLALEEAALGTREWVDRLKGENETDAAFFVRRFEALRAEPRLALAAGADGLDAIEIIARDCPAILADDGLLAIEHGAEQKEAVAERLLAYGWQRIRCYDDYSGLPRVTSAHNSETT